MRRSRLEVEAAVGLGDLWIALQIVLDVDVARQFVIVGANEALRAALPYLQARSNGTDVAQYVLEALI